VKTKELLEVLKECDPEQEVSFQAADGCCGEYFELQADDFEHQYDYNKKTKKWDVPGWAVIRFPSLPGYRSCIQSGGTKRADKEYWEKFGKKIE